MKLEVDLEVSVVEKITVEVSDSELADWAKDAGVEVADLSREELKRFLECGDPDEEVFRHSSHYRPTSLYTIEAVDFVNRPEPKP